MKDDKFDWKIKNRRDISKRRVRKAQKLEKGWMICIRTIWSVLLTVVIEQFVAHLDHKVSMLIAIVIMMHVYIPIYNEVERWNNN
ncbi:hypothetical protein BN2127_JRS1_05051 [Bacillus cereus]|nr:hypothetical protein BN2127_JRS1_05051 [Bacillus cereus]